MANQKPASNIGKAIGALGGDEWKQQVRRFDNAPIWELLGTEHPRKILPDWLFMDRDSLPPKSTSENSPFEQLKERFNQNKPTRSNTMASNQPSWEDIQRSRAILEKDRNLFNKISPFNVQKPTIAQLEGIERSGQPNWEDIKNHQRRRVEQMQLEHQQLIKSNRARQEKAREIAPIPNTRSPSWEDVLRSGQMYRGGDFALENYAPPFGQGVPYNSPGPARDVQRGGFNHLRGGPGATQIPRVYENMHTPRGRFEERERIKEEVERRGLDMDTNLYRLEELRDILNPPYPKNNKWTHPNNLGGYYKSFR